MKLRKDLHVEYVSISSINCILYSCSIKIKELEKNTFRYDRCFFQLNNR